MAKCVVKSSVPNTVWLNGFNALKTVFDGVSFASQYDKIILFDSYVANLSLMILYAYEHKLDPAKYISGIKQYVREYAAETNNIKVPKKQNTR